MDKKDIHDGHVAMSITTRPGDHTVVVFGVMTDYLEEEIRWDVDREKWETVKKVVDDYFAGKTP